MFNARDAQRIANAVMAHERRGRKHPPITYPTVPAATTALKLSKTTAAWSRGSKQTLKTYAGDAGSETAATGQDFDAWNYVADLPSGVWVLVGYCNASYYLVSFDFEGLTNFSQGRQQVLGHAANAGLSWINTTNCP
jgi:hypothetical protein